jgi:hypothetical protein
MASAAKTVEWASTFEKKSIKKRKNIYKLCDLYGWHTLIKMKSFFITLKGTFRVAYQYSTENRSHVLLYLAL